MAASILAAYGARIAAEDAPEVHSGGMCDRAETSEIGPGDDIRMCLAIAGHGSKIGIEQVNAERACADLDGLLDLPPLGVDHGHRPA